MAVSQASCALSSSSRTNGSAVTRQRAMAEREQQCTAHPRDCRRADTAIDGVTFVEQIEKRLRERAVAAAGLDDADEIGLGANLR